MHMGCIGLRVNYRVCNAVLFFAILFHNKLTLPNLTIVKPSIEIRTQ